MVEEPHEPRVICSVVSPLTKVDTRLPSLPLVQESFSEEVTLDSILQDNSKEAILLNGILTSPVSSVILTALLTPFQK